MLLKFPIASVNVPAATLTADEQAFLDGPVQELLGMIDDSVIQNGIHLPNDILEFLKKERIYSLIIPKS